MEALKSNKQVENGPILASIEQIDSAIQILPPLTRKDVGPGMLILVDKTLPLQPSRDTLDPPPMQKWAEEGFTVLQIQLEDNCDSLKFEEILEKALKSLRGHEKCQPKDKIGLITYFPVQSGISNSALKSIDWNGTLCSDIKAFVSFGSNIINSSRPQLLHWALENEPETIQLDQKIFRYPNVAQDFVLPASSSYNPSAAALAHTRTLTFLKPVLGGPYFDLEAIWEEHCALEFAVRDVDATMATMVAEPYVNHIPTMTGGIGRAALTEFYREHFIFSNPADTAIELVSRTVGIDRVIDEFLASLTHDTVIDWMLPGIPPTGKKICIPCTSIINIRGDKLFHEHISWDQATVLRQIGLLPEYLPFPYPLADGKEPAPGKRFEYKVPVAGIETAQKLKDEHSVPSNQMFDFGIREVKN